MTGSLPRPFCTSSMQTALDEVIENFKYLEGCLFTCGFHPIGINKGWFHFTVNANNTNGFMKKKKVLKTREKKQFKSLLTWHECYVAVMTAHGPSTLLHVHNLATFNNRWILSFSSILNGLDSKLFHWLLLITGNNYFTCTKYSTDHFHLCATLIDFIKQFSEN